MKPGDRVTFHELKLEHVRMFLNEGLNYQEIAPIVGQTAKTVGRLAQEIKVDYSLPSAEPAPPPPPNEPPPPGA